MLTKQLVITCYKLPVHRVQIQPLPDVMWEGKRTYFYTQQNYSGFSESLCGGREAQTKTPVMTVCIRLGGKIAPLPFALVNGCIIYTQTHKLAPDRTPVGVLNVCRFGNQTGWDEKLVYYRFYFL